MDLIKCLPLCFKLVFQLTINDPENVLIKNTGGKVIMHPGGLATTLGRERCSICGRPGVKTFPVNDHSKIMKHG